MRLNRYQLPHPEDYYRDLDLRLSGTGKWRTTSCSFCDSRDAMRLNLVSGGFCCRDCGACGNDVLDHHMELTGADAVHGLKALGCFLLAGAAASIAPRYSGARHGV